MISRSRDVENVKRRIGRTFQERGLGFRPHRRAPLRQIGALDQGRGHAEAWQQLLDHVEARAEQRPGGDDMIAGLELTHQAAVTAAMPLAVARAASAPSSMAIRARTSSTVGLRSANKCKPGSVPLNRASAASMVS